MSPSDKREATCPQTGGSVHSTARCWPPISFRPGPSSRSGSWFRRSTACMSGRTSRWDCSPATICIWRRSRRSDSRGCWHWAGSPSSRFSRSSWFSSPGRRSAKPGGGNEALGMALAIGSVISFAAMVMASQVGEPAAMRLHATELLMLLGTAIVLMIERPVQSGAGETSSDLSLQQSLSLQQPQLPYNS
jgi:hypothetical protein